MDKQAVLFATQQAAFRESRVEKELAVFLKNQLSSAEKKAEETRDARLDAIHERYAPPLRKFTDLYSRKKERPDKATSRPGNPNIKELRKASRIKRIDAELK